MLCSACGNEVVSGAAFCGSCGAPMSADAGGQTPSASAKPVATQEGSAKASSNVSAQSSGAPVTYEDLMRLERYKEERRKFERAKESAQEALMYAEENLARLTKSYTTCSVVAKVLLIMFAIGAALSFVEGVVKAFQYGSVMYLVGMVIGIGLSVVAACMVASIPFGLSAIWQFFKSHSFAFFASVMIMVVLCMLVVLLAACIGIPCFFSLRSKVREAEQEVETARQRLAALQA